MRMRRLLLGVPLWGCVAGVVACAGAPPSGDSGVMDAAMDASANTPCASNRDCDDQLFCNGLERCMPSAATADRRGCVSGVLPCAPGSACNEVLARCESGEAGSCDQDGDGVPGPQCGGTDCDDHDPYASPRLREQCDGLLPDSRAARDHDEDCNPCTVTDLAPDGDSDRDNYPSNRCTNPWATSDAPIGCNAMTTRLLQPRAGEPRGLVVGSDCDDRAPVAADGGSDPGGRDVHPNQAEVCNGIDDNCDGTPDEGNPGGGGTCGSPLPGLCQPGHLNCQSGALVCTPDVRPGTHAEECNGIDDDCDGVVDNGDPGGGAACTTAPPGTCDPHIHCMTGSLQCTGPSSGMSERCNGVDDNCNGMIDEGPPPCPAVPQGVGRCASGACTFTCNSGWANCDGSQINGCEVATATDVRNCGACGRTCPTVPNGTPACVMGVCQPMCNPGFMNCGGQCVPSGACTNGLTGYCAASGTYVCSGTTSVCNALPPAVPSTAINLDTNTPPRAVVTTGSATCGSRVGSEFRVTRTNNCTQTDQAIQVSFPGGLPTRSTTRVTFSWRFSSSYAGGYGGSCGVTARGTSMSSLSSGPFGGGGSVDLRSATGTFSIYFSGDSSTGVCYIPASVGIYCGIYTIGVTNPPDLYLTVTSVGP